MKSQELVTANNRILVWVMLHTIGHDVIYCDTDSIKYIPNHNLFRKESNEKTGTCNHGN